MVTLPSCPPDTPLKGGKAASRRRAGGWLFRNASRGFTLLELLLVMLLLALLASLAVPVVTQSIARARESALRADLQALRKAIDDFHADHGAYPKELDELVRKRYLRRIPPDPLTERRDTWVLVRAEDDKAAQASGIQDVRSGSEAQAGDGSYFKDW